MLFIFYVRFMFKPTPSPLFTVTLKDLICITCVLEVLLLIPLTSAIITIYNQFIPNVFSIFPLKMLDSYSMPKKTQQSFSNCLS